MTGLCFCVGFVFSGVNKAGKKIPHHAQGGGPDTAMIALASS